MRCADSSQDVTVHDCTAEVLSSPVKSCAWASQLGVPQQQIGQTCMRCADSSQDGTVHDCVAEVLKAL